MVAVQGGKTASLRALVGISSGSSASLARYSARCPGEGHDKDKGKENDNNQHWCYPFFLLEIEIYVTGYEQVTALSISWGGVMREK